MPLQGPPALYSTTKEIGIGENETKAIDIDDGGAQTVNCGRKLKLQMSFKVKKLDVRARSNPARLLGICMC